MRTPTIRLTRRVNAFVPLRHLAALFAATAIALMPHVALGQFRIADQVRLLSAIHIASPWSSYASDVWITNETNDPVSVSVTYGSANGAPNPITRRDVIKLAPRQQCEFVDFLGAATSPSPLCKFTGAPITTSGFGQAVFNGCLEGADCSWDTSTAGAPNPNGKGDSGPPPSVTKNYRNISVQSRIYSYPTASGPTAPTVGQDFGGVPWWSYGDIGHPLRVAGIRASGTEHTNIGLVNASDTKPATLIVSLYDGASHGLRDEVMVQLAPFESRQQGATELFPKLGEWSRLNRTRAATNAYITVAAAGVDDTFFAYGSLIDSRSGDATTLEATFDEALWDPPFGGRAAAVFGAPFNLTPQPWWWPQAVASAPQGLRIAAKSVRGSATSAPALCRVLGPLSTHGDYLFQTPDPLGRLDANGNAIWLTNFHLDANEVDKARWSCLSDEKVNVVTGRQR